MATPPISAEARLRRTVNVALTLAVLLDLLAQATHLVPDGSSWAFVAILAAVAVATAVLLLAHPRGRRHHSLG
jgi:hypothetical protein